MELSDDQLHSRRDRLVGVFEGAWGEIGWELQTCKKAEDLIHIFTPLAGSYVGNVISVLCRPLLEKSSTTALRKVRKEVRAIYGPTRAVEVQRRNAEEQLQSVDQALAHASEIDRQIIEQERTKWQEVKTTLDAQYKELADKERRLRERLLDLQASFARQELFRFLKSKKYTLTPTSLANATANLPYTGWCQSMRRCTKQPYTVATGLVYLIFKAIRFVSASASKETEDAFVGCFRERIPVLPSRYRLPRTDLMEKWLYLERAVRAAFQTKSHPKALPFEITKRYLKNASVQSPTDKVLANVVRLAPSLRTKSGTSKKIR